MGRAELRMLQACTQLSQCPSSFPALHGLTHSDSDYTSALPRTARAHYFDSPKYGTRRPDHAPGRRECGGAARLRAPQARQRRATAAACPARPQPSLAHAAPP